MKTILIIIASIISTMTFSQSDIEKEMLRYKNGNIVEYVIEKDTLFLEEYNGKIVEHISYPECSNDKEFETIYKYVVYQPFIVNKIKYNKDLKTGYKIKISIENDYRYYHRFNLDLSYNGVKIEDSLSYELFPFVKNVVDFTNGLDYIIKENQIKEYNVYSFFNTINADGKSFFECYILVTD